MRHLILGQEEESTLCVGAIWAGLMMVMSCVRISGSVFFLSVHLCNSIFLSVVSMSIFVDFNSILMTPLNQNKSLVCVLALRASILVHS